jgi:CheY-like chemotaxis protein
MLLGLWGHDVRAVASGRAALAAGESFSPHVAILDLELSDMHGAGVAAQLRTQASMPVALVALTGHSEPDVRERAIAAGFDAFFTKPCRLDDLQAFLDGVGAARKLG